MCKKEYDNDELKRINQEIEEELNAEDLGKEIEKEKKQFMTIKFVCMLILVLLMLGSLIKLFM
ncbi:hypothetical protein [Staphylococcus caeli]|uniref:Uncharacterized protein n=1 Tax=Staphylococcus caeli TaxID=2201815 RepID=A0A1D4JU48_9STAP|nr:hypothetical protein [Staphylococcus caeli]SCS65223.1 Uncharacterised protein [Staphylococcus caeli]SCS87548.1 Uncharacterised protein [Staphylococcus caeli]